MYDIADGWAEPADGDRTVVLCMDEFGPLNLQRHPGKSGRRWAAGTKPAAVARHIEAQFQALRYFVLDGTDHESHHASPAWSAARALTSKITVVVFRLLGGDGLVGRPSRCG